jgi:hypothetical protein
MSRLQTIGFELNSSTASMEFTAIFGSPTIQSSVVRSGSYAGEISSLVSGTAQGFRYQVNPSAQSASFSQQCFRFATLPSAENCICLLNDQQNNTSPVAYITIDNTGALRLYDEDGVIGSPSSALATGIFHYIEVQFDRSAAAGSHIVEARVDGVVFATASDRSVGAGVLALAWGGNLLSEAQTTGLWYIDDIAINNNAGGVEDGYIGGQKVILRSSNASGDNNAFLDTAGAAGTANNYQLVDDIPPNDVTDFVQSVTANAKDMYNIANSGLNSADVINVVQVGARFRNGTADAVTAFKVRAEKTSGGTISESSAIIPNSTTWVSNAIAAPRNMPLTMHTDPDAAVWTPSTLDSMQIGMEISAAGTNTIQVSAIWAYISYTEGAATRTLAANII